MQDLPESEKIYRVVLSNKSKYTVKGDEVLAIYNSPTNHVKLNSGSVINKAHIVEAVFLKKETKEHFRKVTKTNNTP